MTITREAQSPEDTHAFGLSLGRLLRPGDLVLLEGDLGAGKTTLVRGVAEGMGLDPAAVSSPTFVIIHEYPAPPGRTPLVHIDAYRLTPDDATTLGLDALPAHAATIVEWPQRLPPALLDTAAALRIRLEVTGEHSRRLHLTLPTSWSSRRAAILSEPRP
jgi:tRNA threonylcarbamoyladenosine biosynthesis protein TsaE